ncbi:hypothetical protein BH23CHL8_BH23CHL8_04680 [soil metagenome]
MQQRPLRVFLLACAALIAGTLAVAAQDPVDRAEELLEGRIDGVLVGVRNDVVVASGESTDAVVVVQGRAVIEGVAQNVFAVDADVTITGTSARVDGIFTVGGTLTVGPGATVHNLGHADTVLDISPGASITGQTRDVRDDVTGAVGWIVAGLAIFVLIVWVGLAISTLVASLLMVAFGTSQARRSAWLIGNHPFKVLAAGFLMLILPWIVFTLLAVTVVGLPLAFGLMFVWALVVFLGYLVAGLWIGERVVRSGRTASRPYAAVFVGVLILLLLSWVPFVTAIATWFGLGAVTMAGWRVLRGGAQRPYQAPPTWGAPYAQGYPPYPSAQYPAPGYAPVPQAPDQWQWPQQEQWPGQDRYPPQGPPASWPG